MISVYRPMLARRLTRLEKKLNIPLMDRHTSSARLHKSEETTVEGVRIRDRGSSLRLDNTAKPILDPTTDLQPATEMKWTPQSLKKSSVKLQSGDQVISPMVICVTSIELILAAEQRTLEREINLEGKGWR